METRSWRVRFVFFFRTSYVGLTSRQHLATVIRYADQRFFISFSIFDEILIYCISRSFHKLGPHRHFFNCYCTAEDAMEHVRSGKPIEKCEPIPHVIYMNNICGSMRADLQYQPALQIVHRCRKTAISCLHQEPYYEPSHDNCRPKPESITRFSKTFMVSNEF